MAEGNGSAPRFKDVVTSLAQLREPRGEPGHYAAQKVISVLDATCARFIAASPFVVVATASRSGEMDVSPKGDPAGFVRVLDEKTLAIPDRLGNNRFDSFRNILENPQVAVIFVVPTIRHTLRVSGTAQIVRDADLRESLAVKGKVPDHVLVVSAERVMFHCAKCMVRSHLWEPDGWPDTTGVPTLGEALIAHGKLEERLADVEQMLVENTRDKLY